MKFENVVFYKSVWLSMGEVYLENKKEIVFVWRSNMGKSSLLNAIFWRRDLVKTSSKPWKTRQANVFLVEKKYYFTDLPGYGFAKLWKNLKEKLDWLISWYLEERKDSIKKVVMLIDSKLWPQQTDEDMYDYILKLGLPLIIVLAKIDKLWNSEVKKSLNYAEKVFFGQEIIPVSSTKKTWIEDLNKNISKALN
jgi:GTP-binding protein